MEATFSLSKYHTMQPKIEQPVAALSEFPVKILERIFLFNPSFSISVVNKLWNAVWIKSLDNPEFVMKLLPFCKPTIVEGYIPEGAMTFSRNVSASKNQIFCVKPNKFSYKVVPNKYFLKNLSTGKEFMMAEPKSFFIYSTFLNGILHVLNEQGVHCYDSLSEKWTLVHKCVLPRCIARASNENCLAFLSKNEMGESMVKIYDARTGNTISIDLKDTQKEFLGTELDFAGDHLIVYQPNYEAGQTITGFDENGKFIKKIQKDNVLRVACNEQHVVVLFHDHEETKITSYKSSDLSENYTFPVNLYERNKLHLHHNKIFIQSWLPISGGKSEFQMYTSKGLIDCLDNVREIAFAGDWLALFRFNPVFEGDLMQGDALPLIEIYRNKEELVKVTKFNIKEIPHKLSFDIKPFQMIVSLYGGNYQIWNPLLEYQNRIKVEEPVSIAEAIKEPFSPA